MMAIRFGQTTGGPAVPACFARRTQGTRAGRFQLLFLVVEECRQAKWTQKVAVVAKTTDSCTSQPTHAVHRFTISSVCGQASRQTNYGLKHELKMASYGGGELTSGGSRTAVIYLRVADDGLGMTTLRRPPFGHKICGSFCSYYFKLKLLIQTC
jgi:hypothetical protein